MNDFPIRFVVPGPPVGFKTTTVRSKKASSAYKRYVEYKGVVQMFAAMAGVELPLYADEDHPLLIRTVSYFRDRRHPDPGNVQKGVCDALFYDAQGSRGKMIRKGDDKYTGGSFPPPRYDKENPRVVVTIKRYERKK